MFDAASQETVVHVLPPPRPAPFAQLKPYSIDCNLSGAVPAPDRKHQKQNYIAEENRLSVGKDSSAIRDTRILLETTLDRHADGTSSHRRKLKKPTRHVFHVVSVFRLVSAHRRSQEMHASSSVRLFSVEVSMVYYVPESDSKF